jgi:hypothetical protein
MSHAAYSQVPPAARVPLAVKHYSRELVDIIGIVNIQDSLLRGKVLIAVNIRMLLPSAV